MAMVWRAALAVVVLAGMATAGRAGDADAGAAGTGPPAGADLTGIAAENPAYVQASAATRAKLAKTIRFAVKEQKLDAAVAAFGREIGADVAINWAALTAAGVDKDATVTLNVPNAVPAQAVLELLLSEAGGAGVQGGFGIDKGVLVISTREDLQSEKYRVVRVYDVRDLLAVPRELAAMGMTEEDRAKQLETLIQAMVLPVLWRTNGGTVGDLADHDGRMVVVQTEAGQAEVEGLLAALVVAKAETRGGPAGAGGAAGDDGPVSVSLTDAGQRKVNAALRAKLAKPISFSVTDQPLEDAVATFARTAELNVWVNWTALTTAGIDKNTKVTVNLRYEMPADAALSLLLSEAGGATNPLGYGFDKGAVLISTRDELNSERYRVTRIYDVRDLLAAQAEGDERGLTASERVRDVRAVLMSLVVPTTWVDNGGTIGSMVEYDGRLLIAQTEANQVEVENTLAALRSSLRNPVPAAHAAAEPKEETRARLRLAATVTMYYEDRRLEDVLKDVGDKAQLDVVVDWAGLREAGFSADQKVNFTLKQGQPAENAISLLLSSIGSAKTDGGALGWQTKKGVICISTVERSREVRVYDIGDLVKEEAGADEQAVDAVSRLLTAVKASVAPTSWVDNGGTLGSIVEFRGRMIVTQTRDNLDSVEQMLAKIRRTGRMPAAPAAGAAP